MAEITLHEYIQEIDEAIERGEHEKVLAHGRHVLQRYPKHLGTYQLLGRAMLEANQDDLAEDMFRRVLSGDPENFVARVGMSIISDRRGDLTRAIWHMERAFELNPNNEAIQGELRRLYGRRDGIEPTRVQLTRGALARLYMRGNLHPRAVQEFRALLDAEPERADLQVALAEALWRNEQRVQAEEACLRVLDELPYCLKANAILGEIWARSGRAEGETHLKRVESLDPENNLIVEILGQTSPLQPKEVKLPHLDYRPPSAAVEQPAWFAAAGIGEQESALLDLETAMDARIEIPSWLEEMGQDVDEWPEELDRKPLAPGQEMEEEAVSIPAFDLGVPDWMGEDAGELEEERAAPGEEPTGEAPGWLEDAKVAGAEVPSVPAAEDMPDWLSEVVPSEAGVEETTEVPDWLREVVPPTTMAAEEIELPAAEDAPDWLRGVAVPSPDVEEEPLAPQIPVEEDIPDWLKDVALPDSEAAEMPEVEPLPGTIPDWLQEVAEPAEPIRPPVEIPDWLEDQPSPELEPETVEAAALSELEIEAAEVAPLEPAEIPDWLQERAPVEELPAAPEEAAAPAWLEGEEMPSGDDALAWLES
ncbi:MAG: hypothetical protein JW900_11370, partial [Anaerolineae bacterium]|nr:hypothetical protein [Anaerolineae bacterium]